MGEAIGHGRGTRNRQGNSHVHYRPLVLEQPNRHVNSNGGSSL